MLVAQLDATGCVLLGWVALLLGLVAGVFLGVLCPTRRRPHPGGHSLSLRIMRLAGFIARRRGLVLVLVLGAGLVLATASAYSTSSASARTASPVDQASQSSHSADHPFSIGRLVDSVCRGVRDLVRQASPAPHEPSVGSTRAPESESASYRQGEVGRLVDMVYEGVRELTGEASPEAGHPLISRMARAAGLVAVLLLAFELIVTLFKDPVQRWRLRRLRGHVVVCGLGRIGRELVKDCCRNPRNPLPVAAIEYDATNPAITAAEEEGSLVWTGDSTRRRVLRLVGVRRAAQVFLVNGNDERNLEAAQNLLRVLIEPPREPLRALFIRSRLPFLEPPAIYVHLDRPELDTLLTSMVSQLPQLGQAVKKSQNLDPDERSKKLTRRDAHARAYIEAMVARLGKPGALTLTSFNAADRGIRRLFDTHILDRRPVLSGQACTGPDAPACLYEVAHFVIIGFGDVAQRLALYLAEFGHFENLRRSRMTIVHSSDEHRAVQQFRSRYPKLFPTAKLVEEVRDLDAHDPPSGYDPETPSNAWMPHPALDDWGFGVSVVVPDNPTPDDRGVSFVCNGGFVDHDGDPTCPEIVERLLTLARAPTVRPMVFLCNATDENNCTQAVRLRDELDLQLKARPTDKCSREQTISIFPYVPDRPMLSRLTTPRDPIQADLHPFGDSSEACTFASLTSDPAATLADAIFKSYHDHSKREEDPSNSPAAPLTAWERHTNLSAALHTNAKLRVANLSLVPATRPLTPADKSLRKLATEEHLQTMAIMEHNRWMAERLLQGWELGSRVEGDGENKRRPAFVHWDALSATQQKKDLSQVRTVLLSCLRLTKPDDRDRATLQFTSLDSRHLPPSAHCEQGVQG